MTARMLVVSPHLDDAVLGCGRWLAAHPGSTVVTVLAGAPRDGSRLTDWDARCGFASAAQAVAARRAEDREALARLHADPVWLDFCDDQYGEPPESARVCEVLARCVQAVAPARLLYPLGLFHADHRRVHEASRRVAASHPGLEAVAYEDVPYRGMAGVLQERLAALASAGWRATPARLDAPEPAHAAAKADALRRYASQWQAFGEHGLEDARLPERFWRLEKDDGRGR